MQPKKTLLAVTAISLGVVATNADTLIYNNGVNYSGLYLNPGSSRVGDEIILGYGTGWTITSFRFEYFGSGFHSGGFTNEQFNLYFYNNDGADIGNNTFKPGSVFYNSGWQDLDAPIDASGRNTYLVDLTYASILLPERFTWAIEFRGIDPGENAGVTIYHPPTVGLSEDDYWLYTGSDWLLRGSNGVPISFGAQITAVPEPSTYVLAILGGVCGFALISRRKRSR